MVRPFLVLSAVLLLGACTPPTVEDDARVIYSAADTSDPVELEVGPYAMLANLVGGDTVVYFAFDSAQISPEAQTIVRSWAEGLLAHPDVDVVIEGHCDERGGREYNLALGERRAAALRDLLVSYGIDAHRITTISYGKERPAVAGHDAEAWALNRRGVIALGG